MGGSTGLNPYQGSLLRIMPHPLLFSCTGKWGGSRTQKVLN